MIGFLVAFVVLVGLMWHWRQVRQQHEARIQRMRVRIHVNGIRGKSTVTRLVAGVLREGGFQTLAKTTGSAARVIHEDGNESPILRKGAPTIAEQIDVIREYAKPDTEALVVECIVEAGNRCRVGNTEHGRGRAEQARGTTSMRTWGSRSNVPQVPRGGGEAGEETDALCPGRERASMWTKEIGQGSTR